MGADQARDDAAPVDVADEHDRNAGRLGEAHVGDVAGAEVDLGRAAGALDEDDVGIGDDAGEALHHPRQELGLPRPVFRRPHGAGALAVDDHLGAGIALRLEQHRVHMDRRRPPRRPRLKRLGPADLAAVGGDRGVVRHVLRLERCHLEPAPDERPAEPGDDHRLADMAAGALDHQGGRTMVYQGRLNTRFPPAPSRPSGTGA